MKALPDDRRVTIMDIARESGVSTATVSRVINGQGVRPEKRDRVLAAIRALDYSPDPHAQGLMKKHSSTLGVLCPSISNPYYMEVAEVLEQRARALGLMVFLCPTSGDPAVERAYLYELERRRVMGLVCLDPSPENVVRGALESLAQRLPVVLVHGDPHELQFHCVMVDQALAMRQLMDRLASLGHRHVAFVREAEGLSYDVKEEAWQAHYPGPDPEPYRWAFPNGSAEEAAPKARDACLAFLDHRAAKGEGGPALPTAIFACNDIMAAGILEALRLRGLRVPQDVSVVGHDNTIMAASLQLSSIDLKMASLGHAAWELLETVRTSPDPEPRRILISPRLVDRATLGPAPESIP